jgi:RNA recognition motif-containing protein
MLQELVGVLWLVSEGHVSRNPRVPPKPFQEKGYESLAKTLYIGNLPWSATEDDLSQLVSPHAQVISARVAMDRETGRSRGFGFVEVEDEQAQVAIDALQNVEMGGRLLTVNEARPRENRAPMRRY